LAVVRQFTPDDHLRFYDSLSGQRLHGPAPGMCDSVAFSPTEDLVALDRNHDLVLWRPGQCRPVWVNEAVHDFTISDIRFSHDGERIVTVSHDRQIKLWDVRTGELIRTMPGNRSAVTSVAFAPDDRSIITGDEDGNLVLWYLLTGQRLFEVGSFPTSVRRVELSAEGDWLGVRGLYGQAAVFWLKTAAGKPSAAMAGR
jgi:WD40 repeat protein